MCPEGQLSTDQSRSEVGAEHPCSRDKLAQQLFKTEDLLWSSWARPRRPWLLGSQQRSRARDACKRPLGRLDRSEVRMATRIKDLANGSSNRHSACDFPQLKDAGFRTHRHAGRLEGHAGDPEPCHRRSINQPCPTEVNTQDQYGR